MTVDVATPIQTHTVAGIGPYGTGWPYVENSLLVGVVADDGTIVFLTDLDFSVTPASSTTAGDVYLAPAVATANAGRTLYIERATNEEQGWIGNLSAREKGLETQLDLIVMAAQERRGAVDRSLRSTVPIAPFAPGAVGTTLIRTAEGYAAGPSVDQIEDAQDNAEAAAAAAAAAAAQAAFVTDARQLNNSSSPQVRVPLVLYVSLTGTDPTDTGIAWLEHGLTPATAFRTWEAALSHAKFRHRFIGRLNTVELRFGAGSWGVFSLGSNLEQAQDYYPFAIVVTCADPLNWPRFNGISNGSFSGSCLVYAKNIEAAYFIATRRNTTIVQDVRVWNLGGLAYCLYANVGGIVYAFGDIDVIEPCSYSSAFVFAQQRGHVSLENGDVPLIFPQVNILNAGNITSPHKYRAVLNGYIWVSSNVYPQMTYASKFWRDWTSASPQTDEDNAYVLRAGNTGISGYDYDPITGELRQWGNFVLSGLATGKTLSAATVTFPVAFGAASYRLFCDTNNSDINVTRQSGGTEADCPLQATNHGGAGGSCTVYWEATGYPA